MNNDIVDRLRYVCSCESQGVCTWCDAADEIVRLRARVTELEAAAERLMCDFQEAVDEHDHVHDLYLIRRSAHNHERALADQLADVLRLVDNDSYMLPIESDEAVTVALAAHEAARRKTP